MHEGYMKLAKKRYAIVGTGSRAGMFVEAICATYRDSAELTALCDLSQTRMNWYNRLITQQYGLPALPTYLAADFDRMIAETKPEIVIVDTMASTHHQYIIRAMELVCVVIREKPMKTEHGRLLANFAANNRTGKLLRATLNF